MQMIKHSSSRCSSTSSSSSSSGAPRQPGHLRHPLRPSVVVVRAAGGAGGFGKSSKKPVQTAGGMVMPKKLKNITTADLQDGDAASSQRGAAFDGAPAGFPDNWQDLKLTAADFPLGKTARPVELVGGSALMVYKFGDSVFVSDANSTAFQFPMTDARLFKHPETGRVAAEVPLDGTVYDLATGAVLKWCPKDNLGRQLLGTLKSKVEPSPLKVYPVHVTKDGHIWTTLV